jgi:hypothetical protein
MEGEIDITLKGIVSRDSVVCFFGVIRWIWHFYTSGAGSFAFKSSFLYTVEFFDFRVRL